MDAELLLGLQSLELGAFLREVRVDEVADTLIYLVELADVLGIDPIAAARDKMAKNAVKYPAPTREP